MMTDEKSKTSPQDSVEKNDCILPIPSQFQSLKKQKQIEQNEIELSMGYSN